MKLVESHERSIKINCHSYWVYVDEYKTIWSIYCKRQGHALCCASDWRYKKSKFKTIDSVVERFINDVKDRL
jgi:hypothetical protein